MVQCIKLVLLLLVGALHISSSSATLHLFRGLSGQRFRGSRVFSAHHLISSSARQQVLATQNCPVVQANAPIPDELIRTLQARQLETVRAVHQATQTTASRLVLDDRSLEPLALSLVSGLRFSGAQQGYGSLNHGMTIPQTGQALERFSCELLTLTKQWQALDAQTVATEVASPSKGVFHLFREQAAYARRLNELTDLTLARWHQERLPLHSVATHLLHGMRFGRNRLGYGLFNFGKNVDESVKDLTEFTQALAEMVDQWEAAVAEQNKMCFVAPVVVVVAQTPSPPPVDNTIVQVHTGNKKVEASPVAVNQELTTVSATAVDLVDQVDPRAMPETASTVKA